MDGPPKSVDVLLEVSVVDSTKLIPHGVLFPRIEGCISKDRDPCWA